MEREISEKYMIVNGEVQETQYFDLEAAKKYPGVYEVIRVIGGIPLFLEKHLERFTSSSRLLGYRLDRTDEYIGDMVRKLSALNGRLCGNVKIVINNLDKDRQDCYAFFIKSKYPSEEQIMCGVPVMLYSAERNNPNAKSTDLSFREEISREIIRNNVYEALLVNNNNEITEGSKSNIFFVKENTIYTPPAKNVLPGVTRGYVMEICTGLGLKIEEKPIHKDFLEEIDGLYMTGTSPQVLPISSVDKLHFPSAQNRIIEKIRLSYEKLVQDYIKRPV